MQRARQRDLLRIKSCRLHSPLLRHGVRAGSAAVWTGGYLAGITATGLLAAVVANALCMRIYERRGIAAIGLLWDKAALVNLGFGCLGGMGRPRWCWPGRCFSTRRASSAIPGSRPACPSFFFVTVLLLFGSAGEELLFRGYGFQVLLRALGDWTTILPVGVIFAALHAAIPTPPGWAWRTRPDSAFCSATLSCAATTSGCPSACISAGTLHFRFSA
jgi:membrane protease YdiL (CAAX protease family)